MQHHRYVFGDGFTCAKCGLPERNQRHAVDDPRPPLDDATPQVRLNAPRTSVAAAVKAAPKVGTLRRQIVDLVTMHPDGLTDDDLERLLDRSHQSVSAARNGLVKDGWLEASTDHLGAPVMRLTRTRSHATVWVLAPMPGEQQQLAGVGRGRR